MPWLISLLGLAAVSAAQAPQPAVTSSPLDAEAKSLIQKVWDASLRTCGRSAFESLGGRVLIELDEPQFHIAPTRLTDAAKQSGYEYQAKAVASARRWRWARQGQGGLKWTPWQEGEDIDVRLDNFGISRDHTLIPDGVLRFDLVRQNGVWKAYHPISQVNVEIKDFDLAAPAAGPAGVPACARLVARR